MLAEVSTLDLQNRKRTVVTLPRRRLGSSGLQRLLLGTLLVANLSKAPQKWGLHLRAARLRPRRNPLQLGSRKKGVKDCQSTGLVCLRPCLQKLVGLCKVLASARNRLVALLTVGRRRGPDILGNSAKLGLLRRV